MTLRERIAAILLLREYKLADWEALPDWTKSAWLVEADKVLALLVDKEPPSDEELAAAGDASYASDRAIYNLGFARGVASQEQELARLRRIEEGLRRLLEQGMRCYSFEENELRALLVTEPSTSGSDTD